MNTSSNRCISLAYAEESPCSHRLRCL